MSAEMIGPEARVHAPSEVVPAGFLRRLAAFAIDSLILYGLAYAAFFMLMLVLAAAGVFAGADGKVASTWIGRAYLGAIALYYVGVGLYYGLMESASGQASVGKMALGIKVTDQEGRRLSFPKALARWAAAVLSYLTLFIGFFMAGFTERKRALHDVVAGTQVVDKWAYTEHPERQQRGLSGCLIAIVLGVMLLVIVPVIGVLAAVAIPAYHDYVQRSKVSQGVLALAPVKQHVAERMLSGAACPEGPFDLPAQVVEGAVIVPGSVEVLLDEDMDCYIHARLEGFSGVDADARWLALFYDSGTQQWQCHAGLPERMLPQTCR